MNITGVGIIPTALHRRAIAIPRCYSQIKCVYSFTGEWQRPANTEIYNLDDLQVGAKLMVELTLDYTGKDNNYYYFNGGATQSGQDNNALIYAK